MYTIALSGPERTRAQAEVALELARIPILPDNHHAPMNWASKFPEGDDAWLTVEHDDVNAAASAVESAGWQLRVHYPTPERQVCGVPSCDKTVVLNGLCEPHASLNVYAELERVSAELAALKARA